MSSISQLLMLISAICPTSWILSLFYDQRGKLTVPGYGLPSAGFGLLAFFGLVQTVTIAAISAVSFRHDELREISTVLLVSALISMTCFSIFSYFFATTRFAKTGIWHGLLGLLALAAGHMTKVV